MSNHPVHWYEGMFLRPQHFQAADRYWTDWITTGDKWDNQYNYGLRSIEISQEALGNQQVEITECRARMRDGTLIRVGGQGAKLDRVDLQEPFANHESVIVYLAVPKLQLGRPNVVPADEPTTARFSANLLSIEDESQGGNDAEVEFRHLNLKILLSTDDLSGHEVLPVAKIVRATRESATPAIDTTYIPPLLAVEAWDTLALEFVRRVYDLVTSHARFLSEQAMNRRLTFSSTQPGAIDDLLLLSELNQAQAVLHCLTYAQSIHPLWAYTELCRIAASLAVFRQPHRLDNIPKYDHDDLATIFHWVRLRIEEALQGGPKQMYEQRWFVGTDYRTMEVSLDKEWLHSDWEWYIGVNPKNITVGECRELLRAGRIHWKLGSNRQIDVIFRLQLAGVEYREIDRPPAALPHDNWVYYTVSQQNQSWQDVAETKTLAARFTEESIVNQQTLPGQRRLELQFGDKVAAVEFVLFAVKTTQK